MHRPISASCRFRSSLWGGSAHLRPDHGTSSSRGGCRKRHKDVYKRQAQPFATASPRVPPGSSAFEAPWAAGDRFVSDCKSFLFPSTCGCASSSYADDVSCPAPHGRNHERLRGLRGGP